MIIDGITVEKFNNQDYVLINKYVHNGDRVYYFNSTNGELFCTKIEDKYVPIENKDKLWLYINLFGSIKLRKNVLYKTMRAELNSKMLSPEVSAFTKAVRYVTGIRRMDLEQEDELRDEQLENFRQMKEKLGVNIDEEKVDAILESVKFYQGRRILGYSGAYIPILNSIHFIPNVIEKWNSLSSKKTRLHECIHAQTGGKSILYDYFLGKGLLEGETESLSSKFFGEESSSESIVPYGDYQEELQYNFPETTTYKELVAIVRQMEAATGKTSHESVLNGDFSFEKEFAKQYGVPALLYMAGKTHIMCLENCFKLGFNVTKLLNGTQNKLLNIVFNKDFKDIQSIDDAKNYFEKLRNFETLRVRVQTRDRKTGEKKEDRTYEEYYLKKYEQVSRKLEELGIPKEQVEAELAPFQYEKQEFKPRAESKFFAKQEFAEAIMRNTKEGEIPNISDYRLFKTQDKDGRISYLVSDGNKGYENITVMDMNSGRPKRALLITPDIQKRREHDELNGIEYEDITDSLDRREVLEEMMNFKILLQREKEQDAKDKALIPKGKENIFQRIFKKIKETIFPKKGPNAQKKEEHIEEKENPKMDAEEKIPSWDMRNYSQEEQDRAHALDGPLPEQEKSEAKMQEEAENDEIEQ